jgi:two-component sensor histidine kinase
LVKSDTLTVQNAYLTKMLRQAGLDAEAQLVAARIQSVLTDEIHHRMKNMLTMITAIVRQSMRSATSLAGAEAAIGTRLIAMAQAHDLLLKADLRSASLGAVMQGAIEQHDTASGRIFVQGEEIEVITTAILPLTLILNELCTNATKYGALSRESGRVHVGWAAGQDRLTIKWVESEGPPVVAPSRRNFGTRLIEEALPRQLGGTGRLAFPPSGVEFELEIPMDALKPIASGFTVQTEDAE